ILSTQVGCPFKCKFCDAGGNFKRNLKGEEIFEQINFLIKNRFPDGFVYSKKFKIQFARIGEPTLNYEILKVLEKLPEKIKARNLIPSISTIAPIRGIYFLRKLKEIKDKNYSGGNFQLQFSIHSTDENKRKWINGAKKFTLREISEFGDFFFKKGDKKITLNFALMEERDLDIEKVASIFSKEKFLIKITPVNPTISAIKNKIPSLWFEDFEKISQISKSLKERGFETVESLGELKENEIGSNCGQYIQRFLREKNTVNFPSYKLLKFN
ncbi:MAG: radical SAM protein, partial [Thermoanaerobaculia bacterium]